MKQDINQRCNEAQRCAVAAAADGQRADPQHQIGDDCGPLSCLDVASGDPRPAQPREPEQRVYTDGVLGTANAGAFANVSAHQVPSNGIGPLNTAKPLRRLGAFLPAACFPRQATQSSIPKQQNPSYQFSYVPLGMVRITKAEYAELANGQGKHLRRIRQLEEELHRKRAQVHQLEDEVEEQGRFIAEVHSNAIGLLSHSVSSDMPDDKVRQELSNLFGRMARDWCLDFHVMEAIDGPHVTDLLLSNNILAREADIPPRLRFNMGDETTAPVLLQAALAKTLCDLFLTEPFFLQNRLPIGSDELFRGINPESMTNWRVHTVKLLETAFPPSRRFFEERAEKFVDQYACLLRKVGQDALSELTELMARFGGLALQLWKRHVLISVEGLEQPDLKHFDASQPSMKAEDSVLRGADPVDLDGRPVQVMVRPRIVSQLVHQGGQLAERVLWSKAVVWVSNAK